MAEPPSPHAWVSPAWGGCLTGVHGLVRRGLAGRAAPSRGSSWGCARRGQQGRWGHPGGWEHHVQSLNIPVEGLDASTGICAHPAGARGDTAGCVWQVLSCIKVSPCRWFTFNLRLKAAPDLAVSPSLDGRREPGTGAKLPAGWRRGTRRIEGRGLTL